MPMQSINLMHGTLTRVSYADVTVPPEAIGLSTADVGRVSWARPPWATDDGVRVGAAIWFADIEGTRFAFDPAQAADAVLRADAGTAAFHQSAIAHLLAESEFARESVDVLLMTHIEDVGMVAWMNVDGTWSPYFPNARILVSELVLRDFRASSATAEGDAMQDAWRALIAQQRVHSFVDGEQLAPGLTAHVSSGHGAGHTEFRCGADVAAPEVSFIGHLAVSPLHLATGECASLNTDPSTAWALLQQEAARARLLVGPLWPSPGFGRWSEGRVVAGE